MTKWIEWLHGFAEFTSKYFHPLPTQNMTRLSQFVIYWLVLTAGLQTSNLLAAQGDWPTYRGDNARSGIQTESLAPPLKSIWKHVPAYPPRPAWQGEAKWDGWNKVYDLKHRQDFDHAFHVVGDGKLLFYGSSSEDKVVCLDAASGKIRWVFYTEGPVRLAPTLVDSSLFVGSDDGHVYRLDAADGSLEWKVLLGPKDYRIPGNGRMISAWPARTGVVVQGDLAYAGVGMFPSEGVFVCAIKTSTGEVVWKTEQNDLPAQGYLVASRSRLYVPTGRNNPVVLDITDGKRQQVIDGDGGSYALLTNDALVFGPGKTGQLRWVEPGTSDQLATFQGNHMIVYRGHSYLHSDTELQAIDRERYLELARQRRDLYAYRQKLNDTLKQIKKESAETAEEKASSIQKELVDLARSLDQIGQDMQGCLLWKELCEYPLSLILSGDVLYTGGKDKVGAFDAASGRLLWSHPVEGRALGLASTGGRLLVSTDRGVIHCFAPEG